MRELPLLFICLAPVPAFSSAAAQTAIREMRSPVTAIQVAERAARDSAPPASAFWRELGDSTLDRLIGEVLRANLDIRAVEARVRGAQAARVSAALDLVPSASLAGQYNRQRLASAGFPVALGSLPDQSVWAAGLTASWELDLAGRLRRSYQAQGALVTAAREDSRDVQIALTAALARTYFELRGAEGRLLVAQRNAENQRRTFEVTQERLDAGRGTAFDTERARAQLGATLASIPALETQIATAKYQIGVLIGRSPAAAAEELKVPAELPPLPAVAAPANPGALVRERPDVLAAERQVAARRALVGAARADYLPRVSIGGSAGYTATSFGTLADQGTFRYAVGPVVSWPLLNLGRVKAGVDVARAQEEEADAQYRRTVLAAEQELATALAGYGGARTRVERLEDAAAASERAAELARLRFSEGASDFLQVLDAERTQLEAQDQLARGKSDAAIAYVALYQALGGRWAN